MKWDDYQDKEAERMERICAERYGYLRERPEPEPVTECPVCRASLYEGDDVYKVDGEVVCGTRECLERYTGAHYTELERPSHPRQKW